MLYIIVTAGKSRTRSRGQGAEVRSQRTKGLLTSSPTRRPDPGILLTIRGSWRVIQHKPNRVMKRLIVVLSCCCLAAAVRAQATAILIKAGHLVDVVDGQVVDNQMVLVEGELIKEVGPNLTPPANAKLLDLSSSWVLPGLIDCHTHITFQMENYYDDIFRKSPMDAAVCAHVYARRTLDAGFTACRDVGSGQFLDVALRKAIDAGKIPGPRLFVAGHALSATGGHGDLN